jgi:DNA-binding NarL/FixJ family response regulator
MTRIVAFVPDLMDRSKVASAAGDRVRFVGRAGELAGEVAGEVAGVEGDASGVGETVDLVVVDLGRPGVPEALAALQVLDRRPHIVGFGSHVDRDTLAAARQAGCDEVLARSEFFASLADLLA